MSQHDENYQDTPVELQPRRRHRTLTVKTAVKIPMVPNYLMRDGESKFDIADVTDEALRELGAAWTDELIATAQRRRKVRETPAPPQTQETK